MRNLAEAHSSELAAATKHLEREAAGRRADVHRLEVDRACTTVSHFTGSEAHRVCPGLQQCLCFCEQALLSAARAAVESSHGQLAAARAAAEALQVRRLPSVACGNKAACMCVCVRALFRDICGRCSHVIPCRHTGAATAAARHTRGGADARSPGGLAGGTPRCLRGVALHGRRPTVGFMLDAEY